MSKLCFSTLCCPEWAWNSIILNASLLGFSGIEIDCPKSQLEEPDGSQLLPGSLSDIKDHLLEKQLSVPCLASAVQVNSSSLYRAHIALAKRYIDTASQLGTPYVRVLADSSITPSCGVDEELACDSLISLGKYAAARKITLLVESSGFYSNTAYLARLINSVASEHVAALWDVNHPYRFFNEKPETTIKNIGKFIKHVHIKDSLLDEGTIQYKTAGSGDLPLRDAIYRLNSTGYVGYYSFDWPKRTQPKLDEPAVALVKFSQFMDTMT